MSATVTITSATATVTCACGAECEASLKADGFDIDPQSIDGDLLVAAEEQHGWGSCGFCPACERTYQREVAADSRAQRERDGIE